jgi:hypothetical protein
MHYNNVMQIQRGVFMNSGSKDVGRDPDWNIEARAWEGKRNYYQYSEVEQSKK